MSTRPIPHLIALPLALALALSAGACDEELAVGGAVDTVSAETETASPSEDTALPGADAAPPGDVDSPPDAADTAVVEPTEDTTTGPEDVATGPEDAADAADLLPEGDAMQPGDAQPDDTATGPLCEATCPEVGPGERGIALVYHAPSVLPPELTGLAAGSEEPAGELVITRVDIYPTDAISSFISASVTDNHAEDGSRGTQGTFRFEEGVWAVFLGLDLRFQGSGFGMTADELVVRDIKAGGCWAIDGAELVGDIGHCANGWPESIEAPDRAQFSYDSASGVLQWQLIVTKDFLIALFPEDFAALAGIAITGDMVFIIEAQKAPEAH